MVKHTPGPWRFIPKAETDSRDERDMGGIMPADPDLPYVCHFGNARVYYPDAGNPPKMADGVLMAAAPALLAEVEREYEVLADIRNEWPGRSTMAGQTKLCRLRDLIAIATGRDPHDVQDDFGNRAIAKATTP